MNNNIKNWLILGTVCQKLTIMKIKFLLMAAFVLPCAMFTACGGGDDDDPLKIDVDSPSKPITTNIDAEKYIDASYSPTESEIQKVWTGEYEGWDNNQQKNTKIKRLLTLNPNRTYTNIIQGVLVESGKSEYVDFEKEAGTYSYSTRTNTITYSVSTDSILDYGNQKFNGYRGKKFYDHTEGNYTEKVQFSTMKDNQRSWITRDTYLQSLTDKTLNIAFMMYIKVDKQDRK